MKDREKQQQQARQTRTEAQVAEELQVARDGYREAANTETAPQLAQRYDEIKGLMQELNDVLAEGATPCPECGVLPHARQKTPEIRTRGRLTAAVYEVACLGCPPRYEAVEGQPGMRRRVEPRAQGSTPAAAVALWNDGERIVIEEQIAEEKTAAAST